MLRQKVHLKDFESRHPGIWQVVDRVRAKRARSWPKWCFLPLHAAVDALMEASGQNKFESSLIYAAQQLSALAAWRVGQGIYRFDPELYEEIQDTPIPETLPVEVFFRLPEWCIYVEASAADREKTGILGFYFHLEWSAYDEISELRFLLDFGSPETEDLVCLVLPLKSESLSENLSFLEQSAERVEAGLSKIWKLAGFQNAVLDLLRPCLPPVIYICSANADIRAEDGRAGFPHRPSPVKTRKGLRFFPPQEPVVWEAGYRLGAALRAARGQTSSGVREPDSISEGETRHRRSPLPHIRRAHWHHYWTGPRKREGQRKLIVRWIPPIPVNFPKGESGPPVPVVRMVKK